MEDSRNMFALFEHNNNIDRAVESRVLVADVLAKFERYVIHDHWLFSKFGVLLGNLSTPEPMYLEVHRPFLNTMITRKYYRKERPK